MKTMQLTIVSAEEKLFSGAVEAVYASLLLGEVGIFPGHAPLLSPLNPGSIKISHADNKKTSFYVSGGILEVQPTEVTVLADTAVRAENIDEAAALTAQKEARSRLAECNTKVDYQNVLKELATASAQLRLIQELKRKI